MLLWVVMLAVGDRWRPSEGDNGDVESDEKSWWPPQKAGSAPAEMLEGAPFMCWPGIAIAEGGIATGLSTLRRSTIQVSRSARGFATVRR
jgi:hypothetical protein